MPLAMYFLGATRTGVTRALEYFLVRIRMLSDFFEEFLYLTGTPE